MPPSEVMNPPASCCLESSTLCDPCATAARWITESGNGVYLGCVVMGGARTGREYHYLSGRMWAFLCFLLRESPTSGILDHSSCVTLASCRCREQTAI